MDLGNFKLLKEDYDSYQVGHPNGKAISVSKKGLSDKAHEVIKKIKGARFESGGQSGLTPQDVAGLKNFQQEENVQAPQVYDPAPIAPQSFASQMAPRLASNVPTEQLNIPAQEPVDPITQQATELNQGLTNERESLVKGQEAESAMGAQTAKAYGDAIAGIQKKNQLFEEDMAQRKAKDDALFDSYASSKIDPDRYWHNQSTGSKVLAGIGMLFSGMGSATTGQPNYAMENINNAINRDIEAQKNDQGKGLNLYKMNREAMHDDQAAFLQTQNQYLTIAKLKANQAASIAQGPMAAEKRAQLLGNIDAQMASNRFKIASLTQGQKGNQQSISQADPAQLVTSMVGEKHQQKAFDEIDAAQNTVKNAPGILESFDKAADGLHVADFIPGVQNADQKSLHTLLGPTFKDVEGTVRQAAMDNLFGNITPQFGDNKNTIQTKRKALEGYLRSKASAPVAKGHGLDLSKFQSTNMDFPGQVVPRTTPDGRIALFDANTKKFLGYK